MPNGNTPEIILHEARDKRSKQDGHLQGMRRIAAGALIAFLSVGTIAVAASEQLAPSTAVVVFTFAGLLTVVLVAIEAIISYKWQEGPTIARLRKVYRRRRPTAAQMQLGLINSLNSDYIANKRVLNRVRALVLGQTAIALVGLLILLLAFRELT